MSGFKRGILSASAAAVLAAAGCDGGSQVIPLADVPPPKEPLKSQSKNHPKAPPGVPISPSKLIYK
jgi:hypothetical protein